MCSSSIDCALRSLSFLAVATLLFTGACTTSASPGATAVPSADESASPSVRSESVEYACTVDRLLRTAQEATRQAYLDASAGGRAVAKWPSLDTLDAVHGALASWPNDIESLLPQAQSAYAKEQYASMTAMVVTLAPSGNDQGSAMASVFGDADQAISEFESSAAGYGIECP